LDSRRQPRSQSVRWGTVLECGDMSPLLKAPTCRRSTKVNDSSLAHCETPCPFAATRARRLFPHNTRIPGAFSLTVAVA
jgi:hypothetical protein